MSNAKPMGYDRRTRSYSDVRLGDDGVLRIRLTWTPKRARRSNKKESRQEQSWEPVFTGPNPAEQPKGRPTPRRRDARAAMLARRRG